MKLQRVPGEHPMTETERSRCVCGGGAYLSYIIYVSMFLLVDSPIIYSLSMSQTHSEKLGLQL